MSEVPLSIPNTKPASLKQVLHLLGVHGLGPVNVHLCAHLPSPPPAQSRPPSTLLS